MVFYGGFYLRKKRQYKVEESQRKDEVEYAEADEDYNDDSQQMYLEPTLLKNQGITKIQKNKQVIVNPNYDPNSVDNEYEYVSSNDLPISDREYELSNNQQNINENSLYDFATAIENKNP